MAARNGRRLKSRAGLRRKFADFLREKLELDRCAVEDKGEEVVATLKREMFTYKVPFDSKLFYQEYERDPNYYAKLAAEMWVQFLKRKMAEIVVYG